MSRIHGNKGRKQTSEQIRLRVESIAKSKALWSEERHQEFVNKIKEANKRRDPSWRAKMSASKKGTPAWNKGKKCSQWSGENHWNYGNQMAPGHKEKLLLANIGKKQSPELIQKRVASRAGYSHSEETKNKIGKANSGERNGNWIGGITPYHGWSFRFREEIRDRDGRKCRVCGKPENGKHLDVHHIDYDKKNIEPDNLVSLCHYCHGKTNHNRQQWQEYFNNSLLITGTDN